MIWESLNLPVQLNTLLIPDRTTLADVKSFDELLCHGSSSHSRITNTDNFTVEDQNSDALFSTVTEIKDKRYLVVLDCYRYSCDRVEVIINRAYPVSN